MIFSWTSQTIKTDNSLFQNTTKRPTLIQQSLIQQYLMEIFCGVVQVLTLASNERVPLTPSMRLLFEIGHLKTATPATVSRAGILFLNYADVGWNP